MARKKLKGPGGLPTTAAEWKQTEPPHKVPGKFEPPPAILPPSRAQVKGGAAPDRLAVADCYLAEAERWLGKSEGVAKAAVYDALSVLIEVWLGLPGEEVLRLTREFIARMRDETPRGSPEEESERIVRAPRNIKQIVAHIRKVGRLPPRVLGDADEDGSTTPATA